MIDDRQQEPANPSGTPGTLRGTDKVAILLLIAAALVFAGVRFLFVPLTPNSDERQYVETASYLAGVPDMPVHGHRLLKPLAPLMMNVLAPFTGGDRSHALALLSFLCYLPLAPIIYFFLNLFLKNRDEAVLGSLLYLASYPMLMYGLDLYTETGAWLFHLIGLYFAARYYLREQRVRYVALSALATALGFLWKEYTALSGVALVLLILLARTPWRTKLAHGAAAALIVLPIVVGWQVYVYDTWHYTYLTWFKIGHGEPDATSQYSLFYMAKSMFALMLLGWLFVAGGLLKWRSFSREERMAGAVIGLTSLGFLAWGYVSSRLYFVLAPVLAVLAARGTTWVGSRALRIGIAAIAVLVSLAWLLISSMPAVRAWLVAL